MKNRLLTLTPDNNKTPSKTLDKNLNVIDSYPKGMKTFYFDEIHYDNFHEALEKVFKLKDCFIVLGQLTDLGQSFQETQSAGLRRKKGDKATIKDLESTEMVLDLDDHILPDFDPLEPEYAIKDFLQEHEIDCDVTWQITSSQKLITKQNPDPLARIRLFFSCHKRFSLQYRKAWSQKVPESDGSVYTCSQPIYTAPPQVVGKDPIKKRNGFIKGKRKTFILPKMDNEEVQKHSNYSRNAEFDFEDKNLPEEVLSGRVYRRYFMPLAFHYANKIQDRDAIFYIIAGKANRIKTREFDEANIYQYIDDALNHVENEKKQENLKIVEPEKLEDSKLPHFPKNVLANLPEPWPMIWENFKSVPMKLEEPLLFPTILALNAFFLRANYVTEHGRRPNMFFLNLTPSTGNKDVNSKNVIRDIDHVFKRAGNTFNMFTGILSSESSITADSSFLQSFSENEELFWINTEATRIFQQIKQAGSISSVAALSDKLIEVVDGHEITGKTKATGKVKTINDPNCQILFYAQPETIERFIDDEMVDSGLFGRSLISIIPDIKIDESEFTMFRSDKRAKTNITQEFMDFYCSNCWLMGNEENAGKTVLTISQKGQKTLDEWAKKELFPLIRDNDSLHKLLTRLGNSAEQLYCIVLGICQTWDKYKKIEVRKEIDIECLIPILDYWKETKVYAVQNLVNTQLDPLSEEILLAIEEILSGKIKMSTAKNKMIVKNYSMVPKSQIFRILKNRTKLIRRLSSDGDKRGAIERIDRIIKVFINSQNLIEKDIDGVLCIGLTG